VPWDGRSNEHVRSDYFPPADGKGPSYFDDDFAMINTFGQASKPAALFLDRAPHLSAAGARLFADRIADIMTGAHAAPNVKSYGP
jgi:hypothetical protein